MSAWLRGWAPGALAPFHTYTNVQPDARCYTLTLRSPSRLSHVLASPDCHRYTEIRELSTPRDLKLFVTG